MFFFADQSLAAATDGAIHAAEASPSIADIPAAAQAVAEQVAAAITLPAIGLGTAVIAILLIIGVCSTKLSSRFNVPVLVMFLAVGMLAGSDGIGKIPFDNATVANTIGSVALAFILFSGGFDTSWSAVKSVIGYGSVLSSFGVFLTALFVGVFAHFVTGMPLEWGLLLGSVVGSTDAAAVFSILRSRSVSLKGKLQPLLEYESGSNDPMAAFLTIFMCGLITGTGSTSYFSIIPWFLIKMSLGVGFGLFWGKVAVWIFNRIDFEYTGLYYVLALGFVLLTFGSADVLYGNGFMAVYVCGMVMGNSKFIYHNGVGRFHDGISWLMQVMLFGVLGLLCFPKQLVTWQVIVPGVAISAFMMIVARPLACFLCMIKSKFTVKERIFVSWVGLRGGAPIVLATFPMIYGVENNSLMFNIVFFIVLTSVLLQGKTIMPVARLLGLDKPLDTRPRTPLEFENTGTMDGESIEFEVLPEAPFIGKKLSELGLPQGALVLLIRRGNSFVVPHGSTEIQEGDGLMVLASNEILDQTAKVLGSDADYLTT